MAFLNKRLVNLYLHRKWKASDRKQAETIWFVFTPKVACYIFVTVCY